MNVLQRIVVIEDDADIRHLLLLCLSTLGAFEVKEYPLASIAIKDLAKDTLPQMILLDVMMPEMSGPEFIPLLRKIKGGADVCIVMLTAKVSQDELASLMATGADFVAQKPFDPMLLPQLLQQYWEVHHGAV
ncbi:response regulator [Chitinibacter bivalviorum]|uniref:Response regulator n=1 Tax=Chitinibacter bivalviorum TaxID=2739434 RepID=A0A7H9BGV4_9NEIS|nr:response regulator [Chitinibacter bivalviorum]QLG87779.1 response regulator [Chitinibacter bivalviorum]